MPEDSRPALGRRRTLALVALAESDDAATRQEALHRLGWAAPRRRSTRDLVTLTLLGHLADPHEDADVRGEAAEQLAFEPCTGSLRRSVVAHLLAGLYDAAPEVRFWCAYALATRRVRRALPRLRELLGDDHDVPQLWTVGEEAAWAVMTIVTGSWPAPFEPEYARPLELPPLARSELGAARRRSSSRGAADDRAGGAADTLRR
jgi:HEAT repeat protein